MTDLPAEDPERPDDTAGFAVLFAAVAGFAAGIWPFLVMVWTMVPLDSCESGSCGGGIRGATVVMAAGFLAELVLFVTTVRLTRRHRRAARWACAVAGPAMPWAAFALLAA